MKPDDFEVVFDGRKDGPGGGLLFVPVETRRAPDVDESPQPDVTEGTGRQRALAAFRAAGVAGLTTAELSAKIGIDYGYTHRIQQYLRPFLMAAEPVQSQVSRKMLRRLRLRPEYQRGAVDSA